MTYSGSVIYNAQPLPSARLTFINETGQAVAAIPMDSAGSYAIDTEFNSGLFVPGMTAVFSAPGYSDYRISAQTIPAVFQVTLSKSKNAAIALALGAGTMLLLTAKPGKKVIGKFDVNLPGWAQGLIGVGILGIGYYFLFYKKGQGGQLKTQADARLQQLSNSGVHPTLSNAQAESLASQVVQAVDDCGTDEDSIFSVMEQLTNEADLMLLISVYGVRDYKGCFEGSYFNNVSHNLSETLTSELGQSDLGTVNSILSSNGIAFKF